MEQIPKSEKILERSERQELNLLTNPSETIQAMALIEGPGWMGQQVLAEKKVFEQELTDPRKIENVAHDKVIAALTKLRTKDPDEPGEESHITYTIYGDGGINRYYVYSDGSVKFSKSHAYPPDRIQKAQELGFEIE